MASLLTLTRRAAPTAAPAPVAGTLTLPFDLRCRSRLRGELDDGRPVALFLPRGEIFRSGDLLEAEDGALIRVQAAPEAVSTARTEDALRLARACYHLGNRHVALEVGAGWLRYLHDHVLDDMVRAQGLAVIAEQAPFEPEPGAYGRAGEGGHGHAHRHDGHRQDGHGHRHEHGHEHSHPHRHSHGHGH